MIENGLENESIFNFPTNYLESDTVTKSPFRVKRNIYS